MKTLEMYLTLKPREDSAQVDVLYGETLVGTLYTNGVYLDYDNEISKKSYNLLIVENGAVINEEPTMDI